MMTVIIVSTINAMIGVGVDGNAYAYGDMMIIMLMTGGSMMPLSIKFCYAAACRVTLNPNAWMTLSAVSRLGLPSLERAL